MNYEMLIPAVIGENLQIMNNKLGTVVIGNDIIQFEFSNIFFVFPAYDKSTNDKFIQLFFRESYNNEFLYPIRIYSEELNYKSLINNLSNEEDNFIEFLKNIISLSQIDILDKSTQDFLDGKNLISFENNDKILEYLNNLYNDLSYNFFKIVIIDKELNKNKVDEIKEIYKALIEKAEAEIEIKDLPFTLFSNLSFFVADSIKFSLRRKGILCKIFIE